MALYKSSWQKVFSGLLVVFALGIGTLNAQDRLAALNEPISAMNLQEKSAGPVRFYWWVLGKGVEEHIRMAIDTCDVSLYLTSVKSFQNLIRDMSQGEAEDKPPPQELTQDMEIYSQALAYYQQAWQESPQCRGKIDVSTMTLIEDKTVENLIVALDRYNRDREAFNPAESGLTSEQEIKQFEVVLKDFHRANKTVPYYLLSGLPLFWDQKNQRLISNRLQPIETSDLFPPKEEETNRIAPTLESQPLNPPLPEMAEKSNSDPSYSQRMALFQSDWQRWANEESGAACDTEMSVYQSNLREIVDAGWDAVKPPKKGTWETLISYELSRGGQVDNVVVVQSSGYPPLDQSAQTRIYQMQGKFPKFPACVEEDFMTIQHIFKVIYR